jgi:hypothetical protein
MSSSVERHFWPSGGYEFIEAYREAGWRPVPSWGRDGWDLGSWPLVIVLHRDTLRSIPEPTPGGGHVWTSTVGTFELALYVEGDVEIRRFANRKERDAATDEIAAYYWRQQGVAEYPDGPLPDHPRGPYRA